MLAELQSVFTKHLRNPKQEPAPVGISDRRMQIYRDLFYKNVEGFLANSFPVLRQVISDTHWHSMLRDYFKCHQARTPLFPKMPLEFLYYLQYERKKQPSDLPYLFDLAHYEWSETAVRIDTCEIDSLPINTKGDVFTGVPALSPLASCLSYEWPVHQISPNFLPEEKPLERTYLVVFRKRDDTVSFLVLNAVTARLLERIGQPMQSLTGQEILQNIANELQHPKPNKIFKFGKEALLELVSKDILLGTVD